MEQGGIGWELGGIWVELGETRRNWVGTGSETGGNWE